MESLNKIFDKICDLLLERKYIVIGIDGQCAAGKTTLANAIAAKFNAVVVHCDDFFLKSAQRTSERLSEIGGNIDYERMKAEVFDFLGTDFNYRPYDCHKRELSTPISVDFRPVTVIEGSYAFHPYFNYKYDLTIFCMIDEKTQLLRLESREPQMLERFRTEWIPKENAYIKAFLSGKQFDFVVGKNGILTKSMC